MFLNSFCNILTEVYASWILDPTKWGVHVKSHMADAARLTDCRTWSIRRADHRLINPCGRLDPAIDTAKRGDSVS